MRARWHVVVMSLALLSIVRGSHAQVNPGFETGDLTGWTVLGSVGVVSIHNPSTARPPVPHPPFGPFSGSFMAELWSSDVAYTDLETALGLSSGTLAALTSVGSPSHGAAIYQDIYLLTGQSVTFYTRFSGFDYMNYDDFAFWSFNGTAGRISGIADVGDYELSPWLPLTFTAPADGTYRLGFGILDVNDELLDSSLLVDHGPPNVIPEPAFLQLPFLLGLSGFAWWKRQRHSRVHD